jgi:SAM-dependent methyltransferase
MSSDSSGYIHGTSPEEQARLADLSAITNRSFVDYLGLAGGEEVCDFGCGLGTVEYEIARRFPAVRVTGIERSEAYVAEARRRNADHPGVRILQADVMANGLPDASFDVTFCRYHLEHVIDPGAIAREMIRVTRPNGRIVVQENDLHNVIYYPAFEDHAEIFSAFCQLQLQLGGDPFIGRKLFTLFDTPDVATIDLQLAPEIRTARDPAPYRAWLSNSIRILDGAREGLAGRGLVNAERLDRLLDRMRARVREPNGVALFYWNRLTARRAGTTAGASS